MAIFPQKVGAYDEVPYLSYPLLYAHPDRMATLASLFGLEPAPVEQCRVLELGCSDGANLLGMAMALPASEFVGVDLSGAAIARGQAILEGSGLKNVSLRHLDLLEMACDYGRFDYIITHGLYSWVGREIRDQILAICRGSLAPQGIAYVSYNSLPGCYPRIMLRDMMLFHNRDFSEPEKQIQQAMVLAKLLANATTQPANYTKVLQEELQRLSGRSREFVYHDELAANFEPIYFHQFMEHAHQHNLQFLAEADFFEMQAEGLTLTAREVLEKIADDVILREQYLDFMRGRAFRRTLLCHREVRPDRALSPSRIQPLFVSCAATPTAKTPDFSPAAEESFRCGSGAAITTTNPLARAMLWCLIEIWPQRVTVQQLCAETEARARSNFGFARAPHQDVACEVRGFIFAMYSTGLVDLHVYVPPFVSHVSEKPLASPLARFQARRGQVVTTLNHRSLHLPEAIERGLIMLLDGTRNVEALKSDLVELLRRDELKLHDSEGRPIEDVQTIRRTVDERMPWLLAILPRMGILMA